MRLTFFSEVLCARSRHSILCKFLPKKRFLSAHAIVDVEIYSKDLHRQFWPHVWHSSVYLNQMFKIKVGQCKAGSEGHGTRSLNLAMYVPQCAGNGKRDAGAGPPR